MAKSKEEMGDIALRNIDRTNRMNPSEEVKAKSLAEQLKELEKTPEQVRREMPWHEWNKDLFDYFTMQKGGGSQRLFQYVLNKYREDIKKFHESGTHFKNIATFVNTKSEEFLNM